MGGIDERHDKMASEKITEREREREALIDSPLSLPALLLLLLPPQQQQLLLLLLLLLQ